MNCISGYQLYLTNKLPVMNRLMVNVVSFGTDLVVHIMRHESYPPLPTPPLGSKDHGGRPEGARGEVSEATRGGGGRKVVLFAGGKF